MILHQHFENIESFLLAQSKIPSISGHTANKGRPRESFIASFLEKHMSSKISIGTGEIINFASYVGEQRNQIDIVLYHNDYPILNLGGDVDIFLKESVASIIEVKSILDKNGLEQCISTTKKIKELDDNYSYQSKIGYKLANIQSYLIAYDSKKSLSTIYKWIVELNKKYDITISENLPKNGIERVNIKNYSIDGIFVLGKGFIYFDNQPISVIPDRYYKSRPEMQWILCNQNTGNLLNLFLFLSNCISVSLNAPIDFTKYLKHYRIPNLEYGDGKSHEVKPLNPNQGKETTQDNITADFAKAYALWNEEILTNDINSIIIDIAKLDKMPQGFFICEIPMYIKSTNTEYSFLLKLIEKEDIEIKAFHKEEEIKNKWRLELSTSKYPNNEIPEDKIVKQDIYKSIIIKKA